MALVRMAVGEGAMAQEEATVEGAAAKAAETVEAAALATVETATVLGESGEVA